MAGLTGLAALVSVNGWDKMRKLRSGKDTSGSLDLQGTELAVPVARYLPLNSNNLKELNVRYVMG